jgi:4'-phosphopantetheinyl transferase
MFSPAEMKDIIHHTPRAATVRTVPYFDMETKLRRFYTYFCIKEAYIKLVGEGLLAEWIKNCEFRNVQVPRPSTGSSVWGEKILAGWSSKFSENDKNDALEIWLHGKQIRNVRTEMQAFGEDFIISTMMTPSTLLGNDAEFPSWEILDLEMDILAAPSAQ